MSEHWLPRARHELRDVPAGLVAMGMVGTLLLLFLCAGAALWMFPSAVLEHRPPATLPAYPSPRLQYDPPADMRAFLQGEMAHLNGTFWVDRAHGIAHIPIAEAMERIARQGIPDWPAPDAKP